MLVRCETRQKTDPYSFEVPMYHVAAMEVAQAFGNVGQLVTKVTRWIIKTDGTLTSLS